MKKSVLSLIVGAAITIAPMTASALSPMSTDSLKDATGQAGVSIALDNIVLYQSVGTTTYTDTDGYYDMDAASGKGGVAEGAAASVVIGNKEKVTTIYAILDDTDRGGKLARSYGSASLLNNGDAIGAIGIDQGDIRPLNIDVASRTQVLSAGMMFNASGIAVADQDAAVTASTADIAAAVQTDYTAYVTGGGADDYDTWAAAEVSPGVTNYDASVATFAAGGGNTAAIAYAGTQVAGVVIGLPTVEICTTADSYDVGIAASGAHNDGAKFIHISKGKSVMAILGGTVEIAAH
ncbi:DUF6160 family protein [Desulfoluna butyratoxydans]|uniref:DUF6160 domain-containing protein n=1 Tax=Desulfoluna butyratoxydans TaxID=231438 RepID=A0A4U8YM42_9BACT|nr:DUF6160 family protein [Desulfoluna butyratoxydans]VFQ45076.1 hypothetical protein MSL71_27330 [Desulfoluna butyratoxydans]